MKNKNVLQKIDSEANKKRITWDVAARREIGEAVKLTLRKLDSKLSPEAIDQLVYLEGERKPRRWKKNYAVFGSRVYPDIGVLMPTSRKRVAIELDHSGKRKTGIPGSDFKKALSKAAFCCLSNNWDYCYVLFYNQSGKPMDACLNRQLEKGILDRYCNEFHTKTIVLS